MTIDRFEHSLMIPCYDTDASKLLKPASFMNYAQEAANLHASVLGFGYEDMIETRAAWVLSRMHVKFLKHPGWRDNVKLCTWHKGPQGLFYIRDFRMTDEKGETLAAATTSWLVLNIDTRRIMRDVVLEEKGICRDNAIEIPCGKIRMSADAERIPAGARRATYSDLDMNGHVNNAVYLIWAMDAVNPDITAACPLKEMEINFNHEVKSGETVSLFAAYREEEGSRACFVEGVIAASEKEPERQAFCVKLIF